MPQTIPPSDQTLLHSDFVEVAQKLELSLSLPIAPNVNGELMREQSIPETTSQFNLRATLFNLRATLSQIWSKEARARLRKMAPWLISGAVLGMNLILHAPLFVLGASIASLTIRIIKAIIRSNPLCQKLWQTLVQKTGIPESKITELTACFASGAWLAAMAPTQALFFNQAEEYVEEIFTVDGVEGVDTFIPLIFGSLRVIFCLYIGIALVRVINAFRNDEDWTTAARVPLIVVLCVVIGDALTTLITS